MFFQKIFNYFTYKISQRMVIKGQLVDSQAIIRFPINFICYQFNGGLKFQNSFTFHNIKLMDFEDLESLDSNDIFKRYNGYREHQDLLKDYSDDDDLFSFENYQRPRMLDQEWSSGSHSMLQPNDTPSFPETPPSKNSQNFITQNVGCLEASNPIPSTQLSKHKKIKSQIFKAKREKKKKEGKEKKEKRQKKDWMKNLYPNVIKSVINKRILQNLEVYDNKLEKIRRKMQQEDLQSITVSQFKQYCQGFKNLEFSLRDIYTLLNYNLGTNTQRKMKKMFHEFFVWYLQKRYTIEIIKSDQCQFKNLYIKGKNMLRYLPELKQKKPSKARKNTCSLNQ